MKKPRPLQVLHAHLLIDSILWFVGAFLSNYLLAKAGGIYVPVAIACFFVYLGYRWAASRNDRYRIKAFETLSDRLATSAEGYGITQLYNMQIPQDQDRRNADTQDAISRASSMFLVANSGASYLNASVFRHRPHVVDKLKENCNFRVVLLDPLSPEKKLRDQINVVGEATDHKLSLGDIIRLCNQYPRMDVRFVRSGMTCSLFITNEIGFYDPYHLAEQDGRIENRSFCFQMQKTDVPNGLSYFDLFQDHCNALWSNGSPIETWLPENKEELERTLNISNLPVLER